MSRNAWLGICILACVVLMMLLSWLRALGLTVRAEGGGFSGQVTDLLSKRPIAGAEVSAGEMQTYTDAQGRYRLPVSPGTYEIHVRAAGYIGMSKSRQTAKADAITPVDFPMVLAEPSDEQRAALDEIFRQQAEAGPSVEELQAARVGRILVAALNRLPANIRVLMPDGIVVVMPLDEYIRGVVPHEVPPYWPTEALKAQAVAARCYAATARRHANVGADVCTTVHCQVWSPVHYETTDRAVDATHNVAATYAGNIIQAYFFGHCDGHTRNAEAVWGAAVPYCRSVACPCGFTSLYGHGVGMCQEGARVLAANGADYRQILTHYYTGVAISAPPPAALRNERVEPREGDTATLFTYEVIYFGSDPPIVANLYIDGYSYNMDPVTTTVDGGTLYRYSTLLQAGEHTYGFHFEDGYNPSVNLPVSGSLSGPSVRVRSASLPTPTPTPTPIGTQASQWSQTTQRDFADGTFYNTVLTREDNGEVLLTPGSTFGVYTSTVKLAPVQFMAVGSKWQAVIPAGTALTISLRSSVDANTWSNWVAVPPMDAQREEARLSFGELLYLRGPYVQYRLTFSSRQPGSSSVLRALTLIFIDSRRGPTAAQAQAQAMAMAIGMPPGPVIISRAAWGADERLMTWPPEYRSVRKVVVHHTSTPNGDTDPAATVRAIYYYHAVTRGWGDIGYNYLIDTQGRIYEGRYGGEGVVGGHAKQYAWGSIGVSLIGDYEQVDVPAAMQNALVELLAWKGNLHFVHPTEHGFFIDKDLPNIMGHRDGAQTDCPGKYAYARLPAIRQAVLTRMADLPPNVRIDVPANDSPVSGVVDLSATGSPAVTQITFFVDDVRRATDTSLPFSWKWNTSTASEGQHRLQAQARTAIGLQAEHVVMVTVDNTPPSGSLNGPLYSNVPTITLTTPANEAQWMQFGDGWHWEGEDLRHQSGHVVSDTNALNGLAWMGRAASDAAGWWYGPYFCNLPTGRSYRVYFRLKAADNSTSADLASIDVTDDFGRNTYISRTLTGQDFSRSLVYQEPYLDFGYYRLDDYGLEFRTFYTGRSDVYLDCVHLFRSPRGYAPSAEWTLPGSDGRKEVDVRYIDAAGNVSPVYSITVVLDTTPPQWLGWDGTHARVRDETSGLHVSSAEFAISTNGGATWEGWQPAMITATEGTTATVLVGARLAGASNVRFRIADRAANLAESPVYDLPTPVASATPSPTASSTPAPSAMASPTASLTPTPVATHTQTPTPSPIATHTPTPATGGSIRGRVLLQGRTKHNGATVVVTEAITTTTAEDGSFVLAGIPDGSWTVTVRLPGYVTTARQGVTVTTGVETELPDVLLHGGDANGDCSVNLSDLVIVSSNFGGNPPRDPRADISNDGRVDLQDLLLVALNLGQRCPGAWK